MVDTVETGLPLAEQAVRVAKRCGNSLDSLLRRMDYGTLLLEAGRPEQALRVLPDPAYFAPPRKADTTLLFAQAHSQTGNLSEAHNLLQEALDLIETYNLGRRRPKAQALAQQF